MWKVKSNTPELRAQEDALESLSVALALGTGTGSELRRPLGISIIEGLIASQLLTLYTTPVVYLYFNRVNQWLDRARAGRQESDPIASGRAV
jgi:hypothetical protein